MGKKEKGKNPKSATPSTALFSLSLSRFRSLPLRKFDRNHRANSLSLFRPPSFSLAVALSLFFSLACPTIQIDGIKIFPPMLSESILSIDQSIDRCSLPAGRDGKSRSRRSHDGRFCRATFRGYQRVRGSPPCDQ